MTKSLALAVGNADYPKSKIRDLTLKNSVNDAMDVSNKLETLGYDVIRKFNCTRLEFHEVVAEFGSTLQQDSYDVGLFYFAGHGVQIDGENFLTAIDSTFIDKHSLKHTSINLNQVIETIQHAGPRIKILILDACRDNPYPSDYRSSAITSGLAPVKAPKGTIIAFSTSPGDTAKDGGMGRNSYYTGALLSHIDDRNIPIEDVFKRVRTTVYSLTNGDQTSWEHTSLIGDYYFNYGQRTHSPALPYRADVIEDSNYLLDDQSVVGWIVKDLRSYDWYTQAPAINRISKTNLQEADKSDLFLIGRNILQAAQGSCNAAIDRVSDPIRWMNGFTSEEKIHMINGIFFEIYFDSKGKFRGEEKLKSTLLSKLLEHQTNPIYKPCFDFIREQLEPFSQDLFYIPGNTGYILAVDIQVKRILKDEDTPSEDEEGVYKVVSIKHQGIELLHNTYAYRGHHHSKVYKDFKNELVSTFHIPAKQLRITMEVNETDISEVLLPSSYKITRNPPPPRDLDF